MKILAIDLGGKTTGYAHSSGPSGTWDMRIRPDESSGMRLVRFEAKLLEILKIGVDVLVFETVSAGRGPNANFNVVKLQSKMQAIVERHCETEGINHKSYNNKTIKARCGVKKKDDIVVKAEKQWPKLEIIDDNHADALWLLLLAQEEFEAME